MEIKRLDWDSEFFNIEVGEIINPYSDNIVLEQHFDLIYLKSETKRDIRIGGYLNSFFETKIVFSKKALKEKDISKNIFSVFDTSFNVNDLYNLAYESGKMSRFNLDKKFERNKFEELYRKWVDNSINKKFADDVLLYQEENKTLGFVSYKINSDEAIIGLIAVDPSAQGKGIGGKLIDAVESKLVEKGIFKLLIPTQLENINACKFYEKKEYKKNKTTVIYHFWSNI